MTLLNNLLFYCIWVTFIWNGGTNKIHSHTQKNILGTAGVSTKLVINELFLDLNTQNFLQCSEGDMLLFADLSLPEITAKFSIFSGSHLNCLCFCLCASPQHRSACTLLPYYCSCSRLKRIASSRESKSLDMVSLTFICPIWDLCSELAAFPNDLFRELSLFSWL